MFFERGLIGDIKRADDGRGYFSNTKVQVSYDIYTNRCWGDVVCGNDVVEYGAGVIVVGRFAGRVSRKELSDMFELALAECEEGLR